MNYIRRRYRLRSGITLRPFIPKKITSWDTLLLILRKMFSWSSLIYTLTTCILLPAVGEQAESRAGAYRAAGHRGGHARI